MTNESATNESATNESGAKDAGAGALADKPRVRPTTGLLAVLRRPVGAICIAWLVLLSLAMILAPLVTHHDPLAQDLEHVLSGPSGQHLLGTDSLGRDLLSRILYGGRPTLLAAVEALAVYLIVGIAMGLLAGFFGGWVDWLVSRISDLMFAMPTIVIILVVLAVFPGNLHIAMATLGLISSAGLARILRSQVMSYREELYVAAARVSGLTSWQILARHIAPRVTSTIIVQGSLTTALAVATQAGLGFLGLGAQPPAPSWGNLISDASQVISRDPWMLVPTGVPLIVTVLALGLLGDIVRDTAVSSWAKPKLVSSEQLSAPVEAGSGFRSAPGLLLSVQDLTIDIGDRRIVDGVSFDVTAGETLGIVGESGSGKSVTVMGILGLVPGGGRVTGGHVVFDGIDLVSDRKRLAAARGADIAYISQDPMVALDPMFTVGQQLREAIRTHSHEKMSRAQAQERALALLADVRLPDPDAVTRRYPHELSGGMAQRVLIAMALASGPKLLLADEPTTALDVTVQAEILDLLRVLRQERGMAIMMVTHNLGVVADFCERAVVMQHGVIVEANDVETLFAAPQHPYTRSLIAATPSLIELDRPTELEVSGA